MQTTVTTYILPRAGEELGIGGMALGGNLGQVSTSVDERAQPARAEGCLRHTAAEAPVVVLLAHGFFSGLLAHEAGRGADKP